MADIEIAKMSDLDTINGELKAKADADHTHDYSDIDNTPDIPSIDGLATSDELDSALDKKADTDHSHSYNDLTDKPSIPDAPNLDGYVKKEDFEELKDLVSQLQSELNDLKEE